MAASPVYGGGDTTTTPIGHSAGGWGTWRGRGANREGGGGEQPIRKEGWGLSDRLRAERRERRVSGVKGVEGKM